MKVLLRIGVSPNALPAMLIVRTFDGRILFYDRILSTEKPYRLCVNTKDLIFTVRPFDIRLAESSRFVKLGCGCNRLSFFFDFPRRGVICGEQTFYLNDHVYGMPIGSACLCFCDVYP